MPMRGLVEAAPRLTGASRHLKLRADCNGSGVLRNRWGVLAALFAVRLTMGFQFQSVAAVAPLLERELGVSLADIGVLIGLYFTPGVVLALPGGAIGQRLGDKQTVLGALLLMLLGGGAMGFSAAWMIP